MNILNWASNIYSSNLDNVLITDIVGVLTVEVSIDGDLQFIEQYYANSEKSATIRMLGDVCSKYFRFNAPSITAELVDVKVELSVKFTDSQSSSTVSASVFYSAIKTSFDPHAMFLTRMSKKYTHVQDVELCSWHQIDQEIRCFITYLSNAQEQTVSVVLAPAASSEFAKTIRCGAADVLTLLRNEVPTATMDSLLWWEMQMYVNDVLVDRIKYIILRREYLSVFRVVFRNCYGVSETLCLTGQNVRTVDLDPVFGQIAGGYRKLYQSSTVWDEINTGVLNDSSAGEVEDLISSERIFLYDTSGLTEEVVVTEVDMKRTTPRSEVYSWQIKWRNARNKGRMFAREVSDVTRVFDSTFDQTFN